VQSGHMVQTSNRLLSLSKGEDWAGEAIRDRMASSVWTPRVSIDTTILTQSFLISNVGRSPPRDAGWTIFEFFVAFPEDHCAGGSVRVVGCVIPPAHGQMLCAAAPARCTGQRGCHPLQSNIL